MVVSYFQLQEWLESLPHKGEEPVSHDGDLYCSICGEPWDKYGISHGDMTGREKRTFLAGNGCPSCKKNKGG